MKFLEPHRPVIAELCRLHGVTELFAFGSVLRDDFKAASDVDLLVVFRREADTNAFQQYFDFKEALERALRRPVDLVCYKAIRNPIFKANIDRTRQPLYAA